MRAGLRLLDALLPQRVATRLAGEGLFTDRFYATPQGAWVPSVTTVLAHTANAASRARLRNWRKARVTQVGEAAHEAEVQHTRDRGTRLHSLVETFLRHREPPPAIPADLAGFWQSLVRRRQPPAGGFVP
jgi:hypothetical protein